eukprot:SAG11_NODE_30087_length_304_cov_0.834146_1_plen_57_part_01
MLLQTLLVPVLTLTATESTPWSSIVQSGDGQAHTRSGQLTELGPIEWGGTHHHGHGH